MSIIVSKSIIVIQHLYILRQDKRSLYAIVLLQYPVHIIIIPVPESYLYNGTVWPNIRKIFVSVFLSNVFYINR